MDAQPDPEEEAFARLAELATEAEREAFLADRPELHSADFVAALCNRLNLAIREDLEAAERLLAAAGRLADLVNDDVASGRFLRAKANYRVCKRDYKGAVGDYESALDCFRSPRDDRETVRTLSSGLSPLSYTGDYARALEWAAKAHELCKSLNEPLLLARLEFNTGHVLSQQDRLTEALERYRAAYDVFLEHGEATDVAQALRNMAVCQQQLNEFDAAVDTYRRAAEFCKDEGLTQLGLEVEYNEAYLHFLRGDHEATIRRLESIRKRCEQLEDDHHKALCDLDLAEIYLELNLVTEAMSLAGRAVAGFEALGMRYEAAKALTYGAIAANLKGRRERAVWLFQSARDAFAALDNRFWTALVDVFRSQVLYERGEHDEARVLATDALKAFLEIGLPAKIATCEVLLARIGIAQKDYDAAKTLSASALSRIADVGFPAVEYKAHLVSGLAAERAGRLDTALDSYRRAESVLESMRGHLRADELKVSFSHDQQSISEGLFALLIEGNDRPAADSRAFECVQKAKSRGLRELLASRIQDLRPTRELPPGAEEEIRTLRSEANWFHRQIDLEESKGSERADKRLAALREESAERETRLLSRLRHLQMADPELGSLQNAVVADPEAVRSALPDDAQILEYYSARGVVCVGLLDTRRLRFRKLARLSDIQRDYGFLQAQLGRLRYGLATGAASAAARQTAQTLLGKLYDQLIRPVRGELEGRHLIVAPHGLLHHLPFAAFHDGSRHLIDEFSISYAPSASVFQLCSQRATATGTGALVLGVPDEKAPLILDEVEAVAARLPESRLLVGKEANVDNLVRYGESCRILHIATHGLFRRDNPMFSAVRLGTSNLSLFDLYNLRLKAELAVLSGCSTGLSAVLGADELVGLTRGLLYAGAQAVLVTLWDVQDESTSRFMTAFYRQLETSPPAQALARAQRELRAEYPHPYHWAPFVLVGRAG